MEQFGTPEEVYHTPATTFVASFIGSPPMNLLKNVPGVRSRASILGIRPEHMDIGIGDTGWQVQVEAVELLGAERLVYARVGGEQLIVRIDEGQPAPRVGETIHVARAKAACTGSTPRPASASDGLGQETTDEDHRRMALPALGCAPRRGQARPREHAGRVPPGRRPRLPYVRVRRQAQRDGVPFLMHDATLERTTNAAARLPRRSLVGGEHLGHAGAARRGRLAFARCAGEPLPTLDNVARWCLANHCLLNIEIKPTPGTERETGEVVARRAAQLWQGSAVPPLLTSFQVEALAGARSAAPALPRGLLLDKLPADWLDTARMLGCVAMVCNHALWDAATVAQAQGAGLRCLSYTVNDEWAAERLSALGTDGIITDRVDLFSPSA